MELELHFHKAYFFDLKQYYCTLQFRFNKSTLADQDCIYLVKNTVIRLNYITNIIVFYFNIYFKM